MRSQKKLKFVNLPEKKINFLNFKTLKKVSQENIYLFSEKKCYYIFEAY